MLNSLLDVFFDEVVDDEPLDVECQETEFNLKVKHELIHSIGEYQPPWWYSPHLAIMIPFGLDAKLQYEREILEDDAGGCVAVHWFPHKPPNKDEENIQFCIFLPCLGGHSNDKFIQNFAITMWEQSYYTVIVSARGMEIPLRTKTAWNPAFEVDTLLTLRHIHSTYQNNPCIFMSGFSAGTTIILRALTTNQTCENLVPVLGVCLVCIIGSYVKIRNNLENSLLGYFYSYIMASKHKEFIVKNQHLFEPDEVSALLNCNTVCEFDTTACQMIYGLNTEEEINDAFSCLSIKNINNIPILGIQPKDDPIHGGTAKENNCIDILKQNRHFIYVEPKAGSHFGFFEGDSIWEAFTNTTSYTYPAKCAVLFFNAIMKGNNNKNEEK